MEKELSKKLYGIDIMDAEKDNDNLLKKDIDFETLINEHKEMSMQITKSLEKIIEILTKKLTDDDKALGEMKLEDLIKLINNYIKSIPMVLDYIESFSLKPFHEKELEDSFSICKLVSEDETAIQLSFDILSRISGNE